MRIIRKIAKLNEQKGLAHVARFLFGRIVARPDSRAVYEASLSGGRNPSAWEADEIMQNFGPEDAAQIPSQLRAFLRDAREEEPLDQLSGGDRLFAVMKAGQYAHCGYVFFASKHHKFQHEPIPQPTIGCCFTSPGARGHHLYPKALNEELRFVQSRGINRALVETALDNWSSRKGIERAGFVLVREMKGWVLFFRIGLHRVTEGGETSLRLRLL